MNRPILLTGSHKSGKSFVAKGIALSNKVDIVYEPMNLNTRIGINGIKPKYWYQYLDREDATFKKEIEKTINFEYRLFEDLINVKSFHDLVKSLRLYRKTLVKRFRRKNRIPLIDDPFAVLSTEWFYHHFDMKIIIMIRHPASFISSLLEKGWNHPFSHFRDQPSLMRSKLMLFKDDVDALADHPRDIIEQGILLWRIIYYSVMQFRDKYANEWYFVKFEDFARDPKLSFKKLYHFLNIEYNPKAQENIENYLRERIDGKVVDEPENIYQISEQQYYFRHHLDAKQIAYIKEKTKDIWPGFYTEADW
jgi:hypothetical protein